MPTYRRGDAVLKGIEEQILHRPKCHASCQSIGEDRTGVPDVRQRVHPPDGQIFDGLFEEAGHEVGLERGREKRKRVCV